MVSVIEYRLYACWSKNVNGTFKPREYSTLKYINKKSRLLQLSLLFLLLSVVVKYIAVVVAPACLLADTADSFAVGGSFALGASAGKGQSDQQHRYAAHYKQVALFKSELVL